MILMDVNVLVYAHREDVKNHRAYRDWLESVINSNTAFWREPRSTASATSASTCPRSDTVTLRPRVCSPRSGRLFLENQ